MRNNPPSRTAARLLPWTVLVPALVGADAAQAGPLDDTFDNATVYYMPWKNFGFGAGWNEFRTNVNIDNASYDGNLAWRYGGLRLFFKASY